MPPPALLPDHDHLPRPPQFGMRAMFYGVAACGGCFLVLRTLGPVYGTVFAWFVLLIVAHVAGNFWGTKMRGGRRRSVPDRGKGQIDGPQSAPAGELAFAPVTRLSDRLAIGWLMISCAGLGATVGGIAGSYLLLVANGSKLGLSGLVLGGGSSAVIGGFLGFLTSSFLEVSHKAWRQALDHARVDVPMLAPATARRESWLGKLAGNSSAAARFARTFSRRK